MVWVISESPILCKRSAIQYRTNCTIDVVESHRISRQSSLSVRSRGSTLPNIVHQIATGKNQSVEQIEAGTTLLSNANPLEKNHK